MQGRELGMDYAGSSGQLQRCAGAGLHAAAPSPQAAHLCASSLPPLPPLQGPAVTMVRRHARGGDQGVSFGPALSTVTGNYVAAKRKGVVNGVDYQHTGVVRFVQVCGWILGCGASAGCCSGGTSLRYRDPSVGCTNSAGVGCGTLLCGAMPLLRGLQSNCGATLPLSYALRPQTDALQRQLDNGNIVLLSNLGYSAAGEVLNCDTYTVATRAAVDLQVGLCLAGFFSFIYFSQQGEALNCSTYTVATRAAVDLQVRLKVLGLSVLRRWRYWTG